MGLCVHVGSPGLKSTILMSDDDSGEATHVWKRGMYGKFLNLPLNFVVKRKSP